MATTGIDLGTIVSLYVNNEKVANCRSHDFDLSTDLIDVTTKDSGGFKEFLPGEHGATIDIEGIFEEQTSLGASVVSPEDLMDLQLNRDLVTVKLTSDSTGDVALVGSAYIGNVTIAAPKNEARTWTANLTFTGTITVANES